MREAIIEFSLLDFVFSLITFLVLLLILKHFLFEKVHDFMEARSQEVQDSFDNAAETNRLADEKLRDYTARIENFEEEGREIIHKARDEAKYQAESIVSKANEEARLAKEQSLAEIERERSTARKDLQQEIGALAVMAAEKIMEREISAQDHQDIIDKIIEDAEEHPWS